MESTNYFILHKNYTNNHFVSNLENGVYRLNRYVLVRQSEDCFNHYVKFINYNIKKISKLEANIILGNRFIDLYNEDVFIIGYLEDEYDDMINNIYYRHIKDIEITKTEKDLNSFNVYEFIEFIINFKDDKIKISDLVDYFGIDFSYEKDELIYVRCIYYIILSIKIPSIDIPKNEYIKEKGIKLLLNQLVKSISVDNSYITDIHNYYHIREYFFYVSK